MNPVNVGLLGVGTVGGGTARVLTHNADEITRRAGMPIRVLHAAGLGLNPANPPAGAEQARLTENPFDVVNNPDVHIVAELIGGHDIARELVLQAIDNGKHIVTANKALIALHGNDIFAAARRKGVMVAFEAAVAGGIPVIKALREGLTANRIQWIAGIINGTGNFILTQMRDRGHTFNDALRQAQTLGYAEADPTFDIAGIDAAHKLTILASIAFGVPLQFDACFTEGIDTITPEDVGYAQELGYRIKHLGVTRRTATGIELRVHPTLIPERRLIANVNGVMNAVLIEGDQVGPTLYYGAGAGAAPTASAVVADIVDIARTLTIDPNHHVPHLAFQPDRMTENLPILPMDAVTTAYYLRLNARDEPGVMADIARILSDAGISIEAVLQKAPLVGAAAAIPIILLTHRVQESAMNTATAMIEALPSINGPVSRIRVEHLGAYQRD